MADNTTGTPVQTLSGQFVSTKLVDSAGTNVGAVDASGRLATNIGAYGGTATTLGQKAMSASIPVVLASDQGSFTVAITANSAVNVAQVGGTNTVTGGLAGSLGVGGLAAHDATLSGNPVIVGAGSSAAAPTDVTADGEAVRLWALRNGSLVVNLAAGGTLLTNMGQAAASANFAKVTDGTLTATVRDTGASDSLNVSVVDASGNQIVSFGGGTQYVGDAAATATPTGTMAMGLASAAAPAGVSADADAVAQWMLRNGSQVVNLASGGTLITIGQKAMAASFPVVLASDQSSIPVTGTFWQATQPVSGTVTANAGTGPFPVSDNAGSLTVDAPVATPVYVRLSDGAANLIGQKAMAASLPVVLASDQSTVNVALAANQSVNVAQLAGAVPSATNPLPMRPTNGTSFLANLGESAATGNFVRLTDGTDTAEIISTLNSLKVDISSYLGSVVAVANPIAVRLSDGAAFYAASSGSPTDPKYGTATSAALGAGASVRLNHYVTSGKTGQLVGVDVASTVPLKVEIQTIVTGAPTTRVILFAPPFVGIMWRSPYKTYITRVSADATSGFSVTVTNKDAATAADVYSTGYWDEV